MAYGKGAIDVAGPIATHAALPDVHHVPTVKRAIAVGTYTGDAANDRTISTGFKCKFVIIVAESNTIKNLTWIFDQDSLGKVNNAYTISTHSSYVKCHATDGFIVATGGTTTMNYSGIVYRYYAVESD